MTKLNDKQIAAYEARGAKRWTKSSMDRLYFNATTYGCEFDYYGTGNIRSCRFDGERVSNAEGYRFKSSKVYIDINTGELSVTTNTSYEDEIREAVEAIMAEVEAETAEPEIAEEPEIATEEETVEETAEDTKPVWSDLQNAIVAAREAVRALAGYGICSSEPELGGKVNALNAELEAWVRGMAVLAEQGAAHVDRASVMAASERRCEEIQNAIANGGGVFQAETEEEGDGVMTWEAVDEYCRQHEESDGFCRVCSSCSGPTYSNLAPDHPYPDGCVVLRGGSHGGCRFVVRKK